LSLKLLAFAAFLILISSLKNPYKVLMKHKIYNPEQKIYNPNLHVFQAHTYTKRVLLDEDIMRISNVRGQLFDEIIEMLNPICPSWK